MNYYFSRISSSDMDSVWSLIEILKAEKVEMSFAEIIDKEEILDFQDNPAELTYVAISEEIPNQVMGLIKGRRDLSKEKSHAVFLSAAIHPDARGSGLAAKLTEFALAEMKNEGVTIARIYVYSDNKSSLSAIKKLDFVHSGTVLKHHKNLDTGEFVDDIIFHKLLD